MPQNLSDIPLGTAIVDKIGAINLLFRQRWSQLQRLIGRVPTVASVAASLQTAAVVTTNAYVVLTGGPFLVAWQMKRSVIDGAASSLRMTIGWTQNGQALTHVGTLNNTDSTTADPTEPAILIEADINSAITYAIAYTSTTPARMTYGYRVIVAQLQ